MTQDEMKARAKKFALRVIRPVESLPDTKTANVIGKQILQKWNFDRGKLSGGVSGEINCRFYLETEHC